MRNFSVGDKISPTEKFISILSRKQAAGRVHTGGLLWSFELYFARAGEVPARGTKPARNRAFLSKKIIQQFLLWATVRLYSLQYRHFLVNEVANEVTQNPVILWHYFSHFHCH